VEVLSLYLFIIGLIGGILSTAAMTITEIPSWKRWGIYGVFEWHENYIITKRLSLRFSSTIERESYFKGIFFFHFLNGALAGIAFPYIVSFLSHSFSFTVISFSLFGILYGFILWILTLVPIHKPITGYSAWNHPLGHLPAIASLSGHVIYGIVLGLVVAYINVIL
jgi:hypothetical protein